MAIRRIAVLTGGGDAPGLNGAIRAVFMTATVEHGWEVVGVANGLDGLLSPARVKPLSLTEVGGILPLGGTILGGVSQGPFTPMLSDMSGEPERYRHLYADLAGNVRDHGIDALVVIGGNSTQDIASRLIDYGIPAVGVPKTIDNDMWGSERAFGFDTATDVATEAVGALRTIVTSHDGVGVLEVMGRDAGWIALHAGIGGAADVILIPEIPFDMDAVAHKVMDRHGSGAKFSIVVAAEGACEKGGGKLYETDTGSLGGIGHHVAAGIRARTAKCTEVQVLGHLQRGGAPTAYDRLLATRFGAAAVRALAEGHHNAVVVHRRGGLGLIPMSECVGRVRTVPPDDELIRTARGIGVAFGDEATVRVPPE